MCVLVLFGSTFIVSGLITELFINIENMSVCRGWTYENRSE